MRDRLIELLNKKYDHFCDQCGVNKDSHYTDNLADYLIENGVIVPPCKVGDKVYIVAEVTKKIIECTVIGVWICKGNCSIITDHGVIYSLSLEGTVFLTREEAEQELGKLQASYEQVKGGAEE
jgi:hypothetical protein